MIRPLCSRLFCAQVALIFGLFAAMSGCEGDVAADTTAVDGGAAGADAAATGSDTSTGSDSAAGSDADSSPQPPTPYAYSGGTCPKLHGGSNKIFSWNGDRAVNIFLPTKLDNPGLLFAWHGLGDTMQNFGNAIGAATLANKLNVIVVVPQSKGSVTGWGWTSDNTALADSTLFDDLLTCVDAQWDIDNFRVMTTGFSAGALWSSYLVIKRSTFLATALIWSGGTGPKAYDYKKPKRQIPVLLAWGGKEDNAFLSFDETTNHMATNLRKDGHIVITCNHNLKHTIPFDGLNWGLKFLEQHRWDTLTKTPFANGDLSAFPSYCSIK